jgi:hypothetical protein
MEPFTGTANTKAPFPSEIGSITVPVLLLASLAIFHYSTSPSYFNLPEQTVLRLHFRRQEEAQSRPKAEINPSCHP